MLSDRASLFRFVLGVSGLVNPSVSGSVVTGLRRICHRLREIELEDIYKRRLKGLLLANIRRKKLYKNLVILMMGRACVFFFPKQWFYTSQITFMFIWM